ncbi:MAG TPA: molybdate ABC transporter substrate-binding protein [Burkholderiales bacterium]|jgi:molybdenum ABC transporter, periplasmic molybdate-binding protein
MFAMRLALALTTAALVPSTATAEKPPVVAAASDLRFAMEEIAARFQRESGRAVKLSFGSSGNYYRQIQQGAPFELFMSADESYVLRLAEAGRMRDRGVLYAIGRIVLYAPRGATWQPDPQMKSLREALRGNRIPRFAIANPEHAPYGRAAEQALRKAGVWPAIQPHLVLGENVSQAAQFASSGSTAGGIFAYSFALAPNLAGSGSYVLLSEEMHEPLRQRMALVKGAGGTAQALYSYLQEPAARAILKRYGFALPVER